MFEVKTVFIAVFCGLLLSLFGYQFIKIHHLENKTTQQANQIKQQSQIISQQEAVVVSLTDNLNQERQAVEQHNKTIANLREQAYATQKNLRQLLKNEPCNLEPLPVGVLERLHQFGVTSH